MAANEPLRLTTEDLYTSRVESYLEEQESMQRGLQDVETQPLVIRVIYSSWFYLSIASGLGGFVAWLCLEPFYDDLAQDLTLPAFLMFPTVAGFIGMFLGAAEGIMCRNPPRALLCALVGLGVGFCGGVVSMIVGGIIFAVMTLIAVAFVKDPNGPPTGMAFLLIMMGRAAAWAVAAIPAGIGQGLALREMKVGINGLLGGVLGGLLGGLLFDPIDMVLTSEDGQASISRAVGFTTIGLMVGCFVGLVEQWTKSAWLIMKAGPLAGKQFVIYRNPTVIGSSPKADIYLFKDEAIEPRHALIHDRGGRFEIEDCHTPDGTYVNGIPVQKQMLQSGDQIVVGKTVFEFTLRENA